MNEDNFEKKMSPDNRMHKQNRIKTLPRDNKTEKKPEQKSFRPKKTQKFKRNKILSLPPLRTHTYKKKLVIKRCIKRQTNR